MTAKADEAMAAKKKRASAVEPVEYVPLSVAAEELGYHVRHVRLLCRQGKLKATKMGKPWVLTRADLEAYKQQPMPRPGRQREVYPTVDDRAVKKRIKAAVATKKNRVAELGPDPGGIRSKVARAIERQHRQQRKIAVEVDDAAKAAGGTASAQKKLREKLWRERTVGMGKDGGHLPISVLYARLKEAREAKAN